MDGVRSHRSHSITTLSTIWRPKAVKVTERLLHDVPTELAFQLAVYLTHAFTPTQVSW